MSRSPTRPASLRHDSSPGTPGAGVLSASSTVLTLVEAEAPVASSALATRTGQTLAALLQLTNGINARRGSLITHVMPTGMAPVVATTAAPTAPAAAVPASPGLSQGRKGRQQAAAARRGTWAAGNLGGGATAAGALPSTPLAATPAPSFASTAAAAAAAGADSPQRRRSVGPSFGPATPAPPPRFSTTAAAARRFTYAAGMLQSAVAASAASFAESGLNGGDEEGRDTFDAPTPRRRRSRHGAALMEAAKTRAMTTNYTRKGGGILVASTAVVQGLDLRTGYNAHVAPSGLASPRKSASATGAVPTLASTMTRVVAPEEDGGLTRGPAYCAPPRLRASRYSSAYGTQTELKRAIANRAPKRAKRDSTFRKQLMLESAKLAAQGAKSSTAIVGAVAAPSPAPAVAESSDEGTPAPHYSRRRHRRSLSSSSVATAVAAAAANGGVAPAAAANGGVAPAAAPPSSSPPPPPPSAPPSGMDWKVILAKPGVERSFAELSYLYDWLRSLRISFFGGLAPDVLRTLCRVLEVASFDRGEWIFRQGERGQHFYVVLEGKLAIVIDKALKPGEIAGQKQAEEKAAAAAAAATAAATATAEEARSPTTSNRPLSASPLHRPGSSLSATRRSSSVAFASRRGSLPSEALVEHPFAAAVATGSGDSGAESSPAATPRSSGSGPRKLVRATRLLTSLNRARRRTSGGALTGLTVTTADGSDDAPLCTRCGQPGVHADAAACNALPVNASGGAPTSPSFARAQTAQTPSSGAGRGLLSPHRGAMTSLSPRASASFSGAMALSVAHASPSSSSSALPPPSPHVRTRTHTMSRDQMAMLLSPPSANAANEVHSPSAQASASSREPEGPVLTAQQQMLGLGASETVVAEVGVGAGFGEVALASKSNMRQASVLVVRGGGPTGMEGPCVCLCLHKTAYDVALKLVHEAQLNFKLNFARELFLFYRWSYDKLLTFSLCLLPESPRHFEQGHVFYRQHARPDQVFFVVSGAVAIQFTEEDHDGEHATSSLLLRGDDDGGDDEGVPEGRWIGASYLRDASLDAQQQAAADSRAADAVRLKLLRGFHEEEAEWVRGHKRRQRKVKSRYMLEAASQSQSRVALSMPVKRTLTAREIDEARIAHEMNLTSDDDDGHGTDIDLATLRGFKNLKGPERFWQLERGSSADERGGGSSSSSSSSSSSRSTDTSASDDDDATIAARAARKHSKRMARKARRRARRRGTRVEATYDGMAHHDLRADRSGASTGQNGQGQGQGQAAGDEEPYTCTHTAHMPKDGATSYHFYKVFYDRVKLEGDADKNNSNQEEERVLRITLKPHISTAATSSPATASSATGRPTTARPHEQFALFAGNISCRYPSKHKHTWVAPSPSSSARARTIILRPASDPNFQSGGNNGAAGSSPFVYVGVFHPLNEAAILAYQAAHHGHMPSPSVDLPSQLHQQQGPGYELVVETIWAQGARPWPSGAHRTPPRTYDLATLGPLDIFGAEEIIAMQEADQAAAAQAALARAGGGKAVPRRATAINYAEVGRISSAVVCSPEGARVFSMGRDQFLGHVRGNMLGELKALLRRALTTRADTLHRARTVTALTEAKTRPKHPAKLDLKHPTKPTLPRQRPQSAHPLSAEPDSSELQLLASAQPSVDASEAAPYHHRPNLGEMTMLTQSGRTDLERSYKRERDHARLKNQVLEEFYLRNPNAQLLLEAGAEQGGETAGHELWVLDPAEQVQARRRALLLKLQAEERAEQSVVFKTPEAGAPPLSTQLRLLMPGSHERPGTAPAQRRIKDSNSPQQPPQPRLLLMPTRSFDDSSVAIVPASSTSSSSPTDLALLEALLGPASSSAAEAGSSSTDAAAGLHGLNPGTYRIMRREEKAAIQAQNQVALELFGKKLHEHAPSTSSASKPRRRRARSAHHSSNRDGPVFGLEGSSTRGGTLSRVGVRLATDAGLRNRWQRDRTSLVFSSRARTEGREASQRQAPFADPSLTNPWLYVPSLYDSAATDPGLNLLALRLGIPPPKPIAQPRDLTRAHRPQVLGPDGTPMLDDEVAEDEERTGTSSSSRNKERTDAQTKKQVSVEEVLRVAELREAALAAAAQVDNEAVKDGHQEEEKEAATPLRGSKHGRSASVSGSPNRGIVACPVANSLWQSELEVLASDAPASTRHHQQKKKGAPFIAKTELSSLATLVLFDPPITSSRVPTKYLNQDRMRKEAAQAAREAREEKEALLTLTAPVAENEETAAPRLRTSSRPGSASMFGSFARVVPVAAAASAASTPSRVSVADADHEASGDEDVLSNIFSLTQVGGSGNASQRQHGSNSARQSDQETSMVLHSSVLPQQPSGAATGAPSSSDFLIPQREERPGELAQKAAIESFLRSQRAGLSLTARMAESSRTVSSAAGSLGSSMGTGTSRPQSATRAILRATRRSMLLRRPTQPPSIPSRERPPAETAVLARWEIQRLKQTQAIAQKQARVAAQISRTNTQQLGTQGDADTNAAAPDATPSVRPPLHPATPATAAASAAPAAAFSSDSPYSSYAASPLSAPWDGSSFFPGAGRDGPGAGESDQSELDRHPSLGQLSEWDRVDVVDEGEREVQIMGRTFVDEHGEEDQTTRTAAESKHPPSSRRRPAPPTHQRPASATSQQSFSRPLSRPSTAVPLPRGAHARDRPTSAFPRPPSARAPPHGARTKVRPHSAVTGFPDQE